jgi:hypothetical protein
MGVGTSSYKHRGYANPNIFSDKIFYHKYVPTSAILDIKTISNVKYENPMGFNPLWIKIIAQWVKTHWI